VAQQPAYELLFSPCYAASRRQIVSELSEMFIGGQECRACQQGPPVASATARRAAVPRHAKRKEMFEASQRGCDLVLMQEELRRERGVHARLRPGPSCQMFLWATQPGAVEREVLTICANNRGGRDGARCFARIERENYACLPGADMVRRERRQASCAVRDSTAFNRRPAKAQECEEDDMP